jgi:hypothetical protein
MLDRRPDVVGGVMRGGDQYATPLDGRVFRLREAAYPSGVRMSPVITVSAGDLREFLEEPFETVGAFGDGGHILAL